MQLRTRFNVISGFLSRRPLHRVIGVGALVVMPVFAGITGPGAIASAATQQAPPHPVTIVQDATGNAIIYSTGTVHGSTPAFPAKASVTTGPIVTAASHDDLLYSASATGAVEVQAKTASRGRASLQATILHGRPLAAPIVGMAVDSANGGYWLVGSDGGVFALTGAPFYGSMGGTHLNAPIVGMASTPTGGGYWLVAADGGIFTFGDAKFHGSMGGKHLNAPVVGMATDPATGGYWEVASDGGVFSFDAPFAGSLAGFRLDLGGVSFAALVVGMAATATGGGYWLLTSQGTAAPFGAAA